MTLVNFSLFDLVGKQLSPRIRDLGKITLYRTGAKADYEDRFPTAGPLLTKKANLDLVADHWDDLLRLAGSLKYGHATASLIVGKLSASSRQNALAAALKEYGAIRRTIYAAILWNQVCQAPAARGEAGSRGVTRLAVRQEDCSAGINLLVDQPRSGPSRR
ncbi:Tn3 family transposase [Kitasatospora sp. NPDC004669]|uniref:Tn3 family transposase n=1 Tax=Kitasatospora sp. NPDC004669 TaxID=3154555 RepID=UPI0033B666E7